MMKSSKPMLTRNPLSLLLRLFTRDLVGAYRPERHYMRGPGPKWREKHGVAAPQAPAGHLPGLRSTKVAI